MRMRPLTLLALAAVLALAGCAAAAPTPSASSSTSPTATATPTPTPRDPIAGMSLAQRVGQLFIVGTGASSADATAMDAVASGRAGGVFLHGRSSAGVTATAAVTTQFAAAAPAGGPAVWIAADQEGGDVQTLSGPGFDKMPTALTQARRDPAALQADATGWGRQLAAAGVTLNLAPVADIVTDAASAKANAPIGAINREYGFDAATVAAEAGAFAAGMRAAGVLPTFKHFPGLGRVAGNTDTRAGVHDTVVSADSPDVAVYADLLAGGPATVMVSSAVYDLIDPAAPAMFSPTVVGLLRDRLGFHGVVVTDDVSAAKAVAAWSPADRATLALSAGVDVVLVSADPSVFAEMYAAVLAKAQAEPAFAAQVDAAARRVVEAKTASAHGVGAHG